MHIHLKNDVLVLCDLNIYELREVLKRKKPDKLVYAEILLAELSYELIPASDHTDEMIRDEKDLPILNAAITADVEIILTGDKDFLCLNLDRPKCLDVKHFLEQEGVEL